ncbi:hypothetical protein HPB50_004107 [Hyalomma asiaticum]|uniref:Uncharacterized protein n=1 Tax=Hyalomma asiaticum TaxID=266040 RepID=A0ACB7TEW5_HYAAI|nr:hypothetical protein HPB50_004107 [Hyalomma asiaticum]
MMSFRVLHPFFGEPNYCARWVVAHRYNDAFVASREVEYGLPIASDAKRGPDPLLSLAALHSPISLPGHARFHDRAAVRLV